jgi:Holliday junction resolvase
MGLNWVEDIVSHLYRLRGYMVVENEDLKMPKGAHSDIDVIAIKENTLLHIECQSQWYPGISKEGEEFKRLKKRFDYAPNFIFQKYPFLDKKIQWKKVFVTQSSKGLLGRLRELCAKEEIQLIELNDIINNLISELKGKYPKDGSKVGNEKGIARFVTHLMQNGFLKGL